jgi:tetraacyldisaccharide 4'-kinase
VISVGNLTLGGTGKTPLVIALAEGLRDRRFRPVILSRGYGRTSRGVLLVGCNWHESGDEPLLMRQRLENVPIVVGVNRYEAGLFAERQRLGNIFILDDGFQHRGVHRDVDLVTVDPVEWNAGEALLPAGRWREPKTAISRATAACVQEVHGAVMPDLAIPSFTVRTEIQGIFKDNALVPLEEFTQRAVVAFAGIAKPERFFATVESLGIRPVKCVRFRDHHRYSVHDIDKLGGDLLLTTEKDAVRLHGITDRVYGYLRISAKIPDFERLMSLVISRLPKY